MSTYIHTYIHILSLVLSFFLSLSLCVCVYLYDNLYDICVYVCHTRLLLTSTPFNVQNSLLNIFSLNPPMDDANDDIYHSYPSSSFPSLTNHSNRAYVCLQLINSLRLLDSPRGLLATVRDRSLYLTHLKHSGKKEKLVDERDNPFIDSEGSENEEDDDEIYEMKQLCHSNKCFVLDLISEVIYTRV